VIEYTTIAVVTFALGFLVGNARAQLAELRRIRELLARTERRPGGAP